MVTLDNYSHVKLCFIYVFRASLGRERVVLMMLNTNVCTEDLISLIVNLVCEQIERGKMVSKGDHMVEC